MKPDIQTRKLVGKSKRLIYIGEIERARLLLLRALNLTTDHGLEGPGHFFLPRIWHRFAQTRLAADNFAGAEEQFATALEKFERSNYVGRARLLRDWGYAEFKFGDSPPAVGASRIAEAIRVLQRQPKAERDERWELELLVTRGVLARTHVHEDPAKSLVVFREVEQHLSGANKPVYRHDNLVHMIPLLPLIEQPHYRLIEGKLWLGLVAGDEVNLIIGDIESRNLARIAFGFTSRRIRRLVGRRRL